MNRRKKKNYLFSLFFSYVPPTSTLVSLTSNQSQRNSNGSSSGGAIEKNNMMSSENPFSNPARLYEQFHSPRTITSITSPRKRGGSVNKSLNLSDENPFHAIYGGYRYPSQVDPSKKITNQNTIVRSTDSKSLTMSDENPFSANYERYQHPPQKRITEIPKMTGRLFSTNGLSDSTSFSNNYRPSLIRQYSASESGSGLNLVSTSIADWARNHPAPLLYRPIQVQRPPSEFYNPKESSYIPPSIPIRQQQQLVSRTAPPQIQSKKPNSSAPLDKTSLNMSPDNPFAQSYGRYYYPSPEEIKAQKRDSERSFRFIEQQPINDNRIAQPTTQMTEHPETEKKDLISGKGKTKFTRFDVAL
jgi:hypothetical protein